jgi:hypothetical protein
MINPFLLPNFDDKFLTKTKLANKFCPYQIAGKIFLPPIASPTDVSMYDFQTVWYSSHDLEFRSS